MQSLPLPSWAVRHHMEFAGAGDRAKSPRATSARISSPIWVARRVAAIPDSKDHETRRSPPRRRLLPPPTAALGHMGRADQGRPTSAGREIRWLDRHHVVNAAQQHPCCRRLRSVPVAGEIPAPARRTATIWRLEPLVDPPDATGHDGHGLVDSPGPTRWPASPCLVPCGKLFAFVVDELRLRRPQVQPHRACPVMPGSGKQDGAGSVYATMFHDRSLVCWRRNTCRYHANAASGLIGSPTAPIAARLAES